MRNVAKKQRKILVIKKGDFMMRETKEMCRIVGTSKSKRKAKKMQFTEGEWETIINKTKQEGYAKPRDYIMAITSEDSIYGEMEKRLKEKMFISILPIITTKNMIERWIDVEENTIRLCKELDSYANAVIR